MHPKMRGVGILVISVIMGSLFLWPNRLAAGMTADQAIAALKAVNPNFKIEIMRSQANWDYMAGLTEDSRTDPKKLWAY